MCSANDDPSTYTDTMLAEAVAVVAAVPKRLVGFADDDGAPCYWCHEREAFYRVEVEGRLALVCDACWRTAA